MGQKSTPVSHDTITTGNNIFDFFGPKQKKQIFKPDKSQTSSRDAARGRLGQGGRRIAEGLYGIILSEPQCEPNAVAVCLPQVAADGLGFIRVNKIDRIEWCKAPGGRRSGRACRSGNNPSPAEGTGFARPRLSTAQYPTSSCTTTSLRTKAPSPARAKPTTRKIKIYRPDPFGCSVRFKIRCF